MTDILGVILCGGKASRFDGIAKHALTLRNASFLSIAADILRQELSEIALSVKHLKHHSLQHQYTLIPDTEDDGVAGAILDSLDFAKAHNFSAILTIPVDTPLLPKVFTQRMTRAAVTTNSFSPICAFNNERVHGLHALWPTSYYQKLKALITQQGVRRISKLHECIGSQQLHFGPEYNACFFNVNTPEAYEQVLRTNDTILKG